MEDLSVLDHLKSEGFEDIEIVEKLEGEHNYNYIFKSERGKFVLRKSKEHLDEEQRLRSERNVLKFLEHQGIKFIPRSVSYDNERDIHITTFVGSENTSLGKLSQKELENWVSNLSKIHSLNYEEFKSFCEERNYSYREPETVVQKIDEIRERLAEAESTDKELVEWAEEKLGELNYSIELDEPRLTHHDIHNSTRKSQNNLFVIDWEFAGFSYYPLEDLADILIDENLKKEQVELVIDQYKSLSTIEITESVLTNNKKLKLLFQLSWSLVEISKPRKNGESSEKYHNYARERKEKFNSIQN